VSEIDLNADVGEGFDDSDRALLEVVTSANIACGFHAGAAEIAVALCRQAVARGVAIGAHVGYRDREGFGRRELGLPASTIESEAAEQIAALSEWAGGADGRVAYVKPHGALYHRASVDPECAAAIVRAAGELAVLAFPGSQLLAAAGAAGIPEGYADRAYAPDGSLVARSEPGAVLAEDEAVRQAVRLATAGAVRSICLHGDTPAAGAISRRLRDELDAAGIAIRAFT